MRARRRTAPSAHRWRPMTPWAPVITQVAAPSAASRTEQDGFASGTLSSFNINGDGVIQGTFSNGQTLALGQIAIATFPNGEGLQRSGGSNFVASLASGAPNV